MSWVFSPFDPEVVCKLSLLSVGDGIALLGVAVSIGAEVVWYVFGVELGHAYLRSSVKAIVYFGEDGVAGGSRVAIETGHNDGFGVVIVGGAVYSLFAPPP